MRRFHGIVQGEVQGVGFRAFTRREADRLGIHGWVRNRWEGDVEVYAEADAADLDRFIEALRQGPRFSRVTGLETLAEGPIEAPTLTGFAIRS
jgi:acylphosphatase